MEAPDKIYLEKSLSNPDRLHSQWYPNDVIGGGIEYIRKDVLLTWAENKIAKGVIDEWDKGYVQCLNDLIDKLNSI